MTLTNHWLKPLRAQSNLARLVLMASLSCGSIGLILGITGTFQKVPTKILIGYTLIAPSLCTGLMANYAAQELSRRLATAQKDQRAIDQQIKSAWQQGREAGRTETLSEFEEQLREKQPVLTKTVNSPQQPDRTREITQLQTQLQTIQAELTQAIATHAQDIQGKNQTIAQLQSRLAKIDAEARRLEILKSNLEMEAQQLQSNKESQHNRELNLARGEAQAQVMQSQLAERDRKQDELERQIQQLNEEYGQALIEEQREGFEQGVNHATAQYSVQVERQQATIAKLQARLDKLNAFESQNRALPTLSKLIGKLKKPAFITAGQGAGKALHSAELCRIWSEGSDAVCAFVLDISEGSNAASSWSRMGIPVTDDPVLFIQVMGAVRAKLTDTQSCLPWRNNPDEYKEAPPIVLIIDEALTSFDGQTNGRIQAIIDGLAAIESRGSKRKVFCIACSTDDQIQNISATSDKGKTMKLWNTGRLKNYYRLYLNDALLHRATDDELKANKGLSDYLATYGGSHFISALESFDGKGKFLKPFKHVSHHSHLLSETKPSYSPELNLVCPDWFPIDAKKLFGNIAQNLPPQPIGLDPTNVPAPPHANLEALLSLDCEHHPIESTSKNEDSIECPHCHTVGRHNVKARNKETGEVSRWKCKNRGCGRTFMS